MTQSSFWILPMYVTLFGSGITIVILAFLGVLK